MSSTAPSSALCFCDRMSIGEPDVSCGDCPTRDYGADRRIGALNQAQLVKLAKAMTAKTNAERQRDFRARKAESPEVRCIFAHPDDAPAIKALAEKLQRKRKKAIDKPPPIA